MLRLDEILEPMRTQIAQLRSLGIASSKSVAVYAGDDDLSAVRDREQPRNAIYDRAEIIVLALVGCTAMQRHAHRQATDPAPVFCVECALCVGCRC